MVGTKKLSHEKGKVELEKVVPSVDNFILDAVKKRMYNRCTAHRDGVICASTAGQGLAIPRYFLGHCVASTHDEKLGCVTASHRMHKKRDARASEMPCMLVKPGRRRRVVD